MPTRIKYIGEETSPLYLNTSKKKILLNLLWGDRVRIINSNENTEDLTKVHARGMEGFVSKAHLTTKSLLELYFIDVGQGDGILIKTPEGKHILIDGGYKRSSQQSGKNAADFVDWKFNKDYELNSIDLDAMISSHNDADHYGGLWDLINPEEEHELNIKTENVNIKKFYHAGVAWLTKNNKRSLGPNIDKKLTLLVDDLNDIKQLLSTGKKGYKLQGEWAKFMQCIVNKDIPTQRLTNKSEQIQDFSTSDFKIKVLAPIELEHNGEPAFQSLGGNSQNTNGNSITLKIEYKSAKILLTGDLNSASQKKILEYYEGREKELAADIIKSCHHGSDDCSFEFLSHISAGATIISSGDSEGHSHPRPSIVAASGLTGYKNIKNDKLITPLIYSTEISRSYKIGQPTELSIQDSNLTYDNSTEIQVTYKETNAGDLNPKTKKSNIWDKKIVGGIIYGLVNVRTDGSKILCATLSEKSNKWDIKTFNSRF